MGNTSLVDLAKKGDYESLESQWMETLEGDSVETDALIEVVDIVAGAKEAGRAGVLGWAALFALQRKLSAENALAVGREFLLRAPSSDDLRDLVVGLYRKVYADNPRVERALDLAGLGSGQKIRKALKTLDVCLHLEQGAYVLHRFNEQAAEIIELDDASFQVVVRTSRGQQRLGPDHIAGDYDFIDADDFRALRQLYPERIAEFAEKDPLALVVGMIRGHGNRMDADTLRHVLCPEYLPNDRWSKWWSKAKNRIKKSPHVIMEGRNPVFLTYDPVGRSLEDETWPAMEKTHAAAEFLDKLEAYLREAKARKQSPSAEMLNRLATLVGGRVADQLRHSPAEAFASALVYQRVQELADVSALPKGAADILTDADDPVMLVAKLPAVALWPRALTVLETCLPERRADLMGQLLVCAPTNLCDGLVDRIGEAGKFGYVVDFVGKVEADPVHHVDALAWLWRGPKLADRIPMPSQFDLLMKMFSVLDTVKLDSEAFDKKAARDVRMKIRNALACKNYEPFRQAIEAIDSALASTIRRQIERADGLGVSVDQDLRRIIDETFPDMRTGEPIQRLQPWEDPSTLYTTAAGLAKKEQELHEIVHVKMKENAKAIGAAIEHGDLSENSEYKFALEERDLLQARMRQMQQELAKARVYRPDQVDTSMIAIGTTVFLKAEEEGESLTITILGPWEADLDRGVYNYAAPMCQNLLGHEPGETVRLSLGGRDVAYTIESVRLADFE